LLSAVGAYDLHHGGLGHRLLLITLGTSDDWPTGSQTKRQALMRRSYPSEAAHMRKSAVWARVNDAKPR